MIPYGRQDISEEDVEAVVDTLRSDFLTQGPKVPLFEQVVSNYCGVNHAVAVNSATSALHIACMALGLSHKDWLWTSPNSFVASANCGLYCGASVDFVDIDPKTFNICPDALEQKLIAAEQQNRLPKVLVAVHFAGQSCAMDRIHELGRKYQFLIIEDASHAIGASYLGEKVGSCRFSDITVFSFHPVKIITTAEGGLATTNSMALADRMSRLRSHGITRDRSLMIHPEQGPWYYEQLDLGLNYRMTELQAALGITQMSKIDAFVTRRHQLRERYQNLLKNLPVFLPFQSEECYSSLHLYPIQLDLDNLNKSRLQVFSELRDLGVGVNVHYIPIHTQPYYKKLGFNEGDFPNAEEYYRKAVSIPMFHGLSSESQDAVCDALRRVLA